jgi:hypothetical protein
MVLLWAGGGDGAEPQGSAEVLDIGILMRNVSDVPVTVVPHTSKWGDMNVRASGQGSQILWRVFSGLQSATTLDPRWPRVVLRPEEALLLRREMSLAVLQPELGVVPGTLQPGAYVISVENVIDGTVAGPARQFVNRPDVEVRIERPTAFRLCQ